MRNILAYIKLRAAVTLLAISLQFSAITSFAQLKNFVIFGGTGVQIGSSNTINGGSVGSYTLVQSTGNAAINSNIHSGGKIILANSNIAGISGGTISAANTASWGISLLKRAHSFATVSHSDSFS